MDVSPSAYCVAHYLRLFHGDWLGAAHLARLLKHFGTLRALTDADDDVLASLRVTPDLTAQLRASAATANSPAVEQSLTWHMGAGQAVVCYEDPRYPSLLKQIDVPPALLFVRGDAALLESPQLAIVGSRKASSYGLRNAHWLAHALSLAGLTISSGLARGIDARAHQGALAGSGLTVAVIGTGADIIYPPGNTALANEIAETGAIVSEFPLGTLPLPHHFPRRNRIMSGMSRGTLVVEAALKSGSLITARQALEQNRDVFAIPGLISNPLASGCHQLLSQGACLVQTPEDILQELGLAAGSDVDISAEADTDKDTETTENASTGDTTATPQAHKKLLREIGFEGCELEHLLRQTGWQHQRLMGHLLELEMAGLVRTEGGRYFRV